MFRRYLIWQHRWIGLLMTAFLIVVGLTGSMLAFRTQIDRLINPQFFAKAHPPGIRRLTLGELATRAEQLDPRIQVWYIFDDKPDSVSVRCVARNGYTTDFDHLILDPYTGQELGRLSEFSISHVNRQNFMPLLYQVHTSLAAGNAGWAFLGYVALLWSIDCLVGFYLTLPVGLSQFLRRWKYAWWVNWRASAFRVNFDLHRASGLWLWPLLFMFAWSGVMFNLTPVYEKVTCAALNCQSDLDFTLSYKGHVTDNPKLDWRAAQARGELLMAQQAALRGFKVLRPAGISLIGAVGVYSYIAQTSMDFRHDVPDTFLFLDADTGEFKHLFTPRPSTGALIGVLLKAAHYGDLYGSLTYRFLVFLTGFVIALLSSTGVYIWWRKRKVRKITSVRLLSQPHPHDS